MENGELLARGSLAKRRPSNVLSSFLDFAFFCRACEPSKVLRLLAKTKVRPCTQQVESPAPWHVKKLRKPSKTEARIDPKSSKIASRDAPGALFGRLWSPKATRRTASERLGATQTTWRSRQKSNVFNGTQFDPEVTQFQVPSTRAPCRTI